MAMPKSVTKINKDGIKFISDVDKVNFTIQELSRAALRDVAKFLRKEIKQTVPVRRGVLRRNVGTWVKVDKKTYTPTLYVGVYSRQRAKKKGYLYAFHAHLVEFGTRHSRAKPFLVPSVMNNVDDIRRIEAQYLSAINGGEKAVTKYIDEREEISDD